MDKILRKTQGEKQPRAVEEEKPHFRAISSAAGINPRCLNIEPFKQRITLTVQEIGLIPREGTQRSRYKALFDNNYTLITNYLNWLRDNGIKLPENPQRKGQIFIRQVEIESGVNQHTLRLKKNDGDEAFCRRLRRLVEDSTASLGIEIRILPQIPGQVSLQITFEALLERGTEQRKHELECKPNSRQQLYNTRSALNHFRESLGLKKTDAIGREMSSGFKESLEKVLGEINNNDYRKKIQAEISWWYDFYHRLSKEPSLPDEFHEALAHLIDRCGLSFPVIARLICTTASSVHEWYKGNETPSPNSFNAIHKFESLFKLPTGTLVNKISHWRPNKRFRITQLPEFLQKDPSLFHRITRHLPDNFCELDLRAQQEIVESIRTNILRSDDSYTQKMIGLTHLPYRLKEWPERLEKEFNDFASFKMAERPPLGMKRNGKWRPATKKKTRFDLSYLFGALCLPTNAKDVRLRGLEIPPSNLSLAFIACPLLVDWYIRFRCQARNQYTKYVIRLLYNFRSMLQPDTGWLRQKPQLASELSKVKSEEIELVSEELISKAQTHWNDICDDAIKYYEHLALELKPLVSVARDPFLRIEGIISMDDPVDATEILVNGMRSAMPNRHTQPVLYHTAIRDRVLILLINVTSLRRNTVAQLNYTGDARGHLLWKDGSYRLMIPRALFKEENSPFFGPKHAQKDYFMELPDILGLNELFAEYLNISRPWLIDRYHKSCQENPLFITSAGIKLIGRELKTARLTPERIATIYTRATERYLVENVWRGTGITEVRRHGPHSARHIRGTASIKKDGSLQTAADANHISLRTAREHYTRFLPVDRNRRVNDVLYKGRQARS